MDSIGWGFSRGSLDFTMTKKRKQYRKINKKIAEKAKNLYYSGKFTYPEIAKMFKMSNSGIRHAIMGDYTYENA